MKKMNWAVFAVVCSVMFGFFMYAAPARAQTTDSTTQQQLASLSAQLNTLSRLLGELKYSLFPVAQAQTVTAPTGITFRWGSGGSGSLIGKYGMYISFQYGGSTTTLQSFKLYVKRPGESSFTAVATFSGAASLIYSSPPGCGGYIYSGSWKLRYCNLGSGFDASESTLSPASSYGLGTYSAYVVAVDTTNIEGPASATATNTVLYRATIVSPIGVQSTSTPTLQWTGSSGWSSSPTYRINVYDNNLNSIWSSYPSYPSGSSNGEIMTAVYSGPTLDPSTTYSVHISGAVDIYGAPTGDIAMGDSVPTFTVPGPIPSPPPVLSVSSSSANPVYISWTASNNASTYKLWRRAPLSSDPVWSQPNEPPNASPNVSGTLFNDYTVTAGTTYEYRVHACNAYGCTLDSNLASVVVSTADTTAPSTPTGLAASVISSSQINLSWTASTDNVGVAGYKVYRGGTQIATSTGTSYSDTGLSPSTSYSYTVAAYDAAGNNSSQSASVSATTLAVSTAPPQFLLKWGSYSYAGGEFISIRGVAVDTEGNVYVADGYRIQKFTSNGAFITKWGSQGSGDGQLINPLGVAVDTAGNVYVADRNNNRIQKFTSNGAFITTWGSYGSGDGQFNYPQDVAVDTSGNVYVAEGNNFRIQKFTSNGAFITKWGSYGFGNGQLTNPFGVAVDTSGNVYVTDNEYIHKFTSNGAFITKWGSYGSGNGQMISPKGIAVDTSSNVYVADNNSRIQKFTSNGAFITKWGSYGSGDGQFNQPWGVAVDTSGNVYVADVANYRIQKFGSAQTATSADITSPSVPTGLTASATSYSQINLSWNASTDNIGVTGYKIYRNSVYLTSVAGTSYSDTGLSPSTSYSYTVAAYDAAGNNSSQSGSVSATTLSVGTASSTAPNAPSNLSYSLSNSNATVNLSWTDNSTNETRFEIYRQYGGVWTYHTLTSANVVTFSDNPPAGTYSYYVVACNGTNTGQGCSAASNTIGPITASANPNKPNAPSNITAVASGTTVYLNWTDNSTNESGFKLYDGPTRGDMGNVGANVTSYTDPNLAVGTYYYKVQAFVSASGSYPVYSDVSNEVTVTVGGAGGSTGTSGGSGGTTTTTTTTSSVAPNVPSNFTYNLSNGGATVNVTWQDNSTNENWFTIYRQPQGGSWTTIGNLPANTTSVSDTPPAGTYYYQVSACGTSLCSPGVNLGPVTIGGTTSGTTYATSAPTVPYVDIKVDGSDGTVYRASPASYTLSWTTTGSPTSCAPSGTWSGSSKSIPSGSQSFSGVSDIGVKTYTLLCTNAYGSASDTVTVEVTVASTAGATSTTEYFASRGGLAQGTVADSAGTIISGAYVHVFTEDFKLNFSAVTNAQGTFGITVPAGTYLIEFSPPSVRTDVARRAPEKFSIKDGEVKNFTLIFGAPVKTITGNVLFSSGQPVTDAEVGAYSSETNQWTSTFTDGSGGYVLKVGGGGWTVGVRPRSPVTAQWTWDGERQEAVFGYTSALETRAFTFIISLSEARIVVHAIDQNGTVIPGAGVVADFVSAVEKTPASSLFPPPEFRKTDSAGNASFFLKGGRYFIRAFLPPEAGFFNPDEQAVTVDPRQTKDVTVVFRKRETVLTAVAVRGVTKLEDGTRTPAFLWAWSEQGDAQNMRSNENGEFTFTATRGVWHIGAGKEIGGFPHKSGELTLSVGSEMALVEVILTKVGSVPLAPPVAVSQSATQQIVAQATDGAKVTVPEGAAQTSGTVNVEVKPTIEAPSQAAAKVVSTVYDVNITNDVGTAVTTLQKDIEITIPYSDEDLTKQGVTEDTFMPSYYDDAAGTWVTVDNYTVDKVKNIVIVRVKHLTRFALVSAADITPPVAPANVSVKVGQPGEVVVTWTNPSSDFSHVKVYRSAVAGELGKIVANNVTRSSTSDTDVVSGTKYYYTVRSVDPAGNESANTAQVSVTASGVFAGGLPPGQATKREILRTLQAGSSGDDVKALQELLLKEGVYPGGLITGYFGNLTKQAVIRFQEKYASEILTPNGLTAGTGTVGPSTRGKANALLGGAQGSSAPTPAPAVPPGQATKATILRTLQTGSSGDDVKALQEFLLKEGVYPEGLVTGYFGELTKHAVIRFQEKYASEILTPNGLTVGTGTVGPSTRGKVNKLQSTQSQAKFLELNDVGGLLGINDTIRITEREIIRTTSRVGEQQKTETRQISKSVIEDLLDKKELPTTMKASYGCKDGSVILDIPTTVLRVGLNNRETHYTFTCGTGALSSAPTVLLELIIEARKLAQTLFSSPL